MNYLPVLLFLAAFSAAGADTLQTPEIPVWVSVYSLPLQCSIWVEVNGVKTSTITLDTVSLPDIQQATSTALYPKPFTVRVVCNNHAEGTPFSVRWVTTGEVDSATQALKNSTLSGAKNVGFLVNDQSTSPASVVNFQTGSRKSYAIRNSDFIASDNDCHDLASQSGGCYNWASQYSVGYITYGAGSGGQVTADASLTINIE